MVKVTKSFRGRTVWRKSLLLAVVLLTGCVTQAAVPFVATTPMHVKGQLVNVELATNDAEWERGLMNRAQMPADRGMLFVFTAPRMAAFWMKDTRLPLSIAFIDADKKILNIADMSPMNDTIIYRSVGLVPYVLEVNQGWFAARGIGPGDTCDFSLPSLAPSPVPSK